MDWAKAKTILIVSFIIINILLVYTLMQDNIQVDQTLNEDFIEDVIELLGNKEIVLETEIPRETPSLYSLIVKYENIDPANLNASFFKDQAHIEKEGEGLVELSHDMESITLINKKLLMYESKNREKKYNIKDETQAINIAKDFLKDKNIDTLDMELSYIKRIDDKYYLEFSKIHEDRYLESAFTNIQLDNTGVKSLERLWLNVLEKGDSQIYTGSAPKSLLSLLSMNEAYGKTIQDISLCYYFDPEKHEYIQDPETAKEGRTIPAWRVQFKDGYKVFIDNY